jgi:hypothetical protein
MWERCESFFQDPASKDIERLVRMIRELNGIT